MRAASPGELVQKPVELNLRALIDNPGCPPPERRTRPLMGYRRFAPKPYYQLSLDRLVSQNYLLRRLERSAVA